MLRVEIVLRPLLDEIDSLSIRILKSAIYHYFRCQIASTLTTPKSAASKLKTEFGIGCVEASDLRTLSHLDGAEMLLAIR
jgi:hypothetical protein